MAYYKIERDIELDILEEPYTYRQAFLDLWQLTNFKEWTYRKQNGKIITVPIWTLARSEQRLGNRRQRSRGKVSRFLNYIEWLWKIEQQNIWGNDWLIRIIWYSCGTTNDTTNSTTNDTIVSTTNDTYKKEEQIMINKNKEEYWKYVKLSPEEFDKLTQRFTESVVLDLIEKIENWITNKKKGRSPYIDYYMTIINRAKKDTVPVKQLTDIELGKLWEVRNTLDGKELVKVHQKQLDKYTPEQLEQLRKTALFDFVHNA